MTLESNGVRDVFAGKGCWMAWMLVEWKGNIQRKMVRMVMTSMETDAVVWVGWMVVSRGHSSSVSKLILWMKWRHQNVVSWRGYDREVKQKMDVILCNVALLLCGVVVMWYASMCYGTVEMSLSSLTEMRKSINAFRKTPHTRATASHGFSCRTNVIGVSHCHCTSLEHSRNRWDFRCLMIVFFFFFLILPKRLFSISFHLKIVEFRS